MAGSPAAVAGPRNPRGERMKEAVLEVLRGMKGD